MVRVRNEDEFLYPSILSIVDHVQQIVLVDNMSDDRTPEIMLQLKHEFPDKIECFSYPHLIARPGEENRALLNAPGGARSPRLLSNYYNWCLAKCHEPFIVKWDGDTVATTEFYKALELFSASPKEALEITGANVHPLRHHTVTRPAPAPTDDPSDRFQAEGRSRHIKAYEDYEPRIFRRLLARYISTRDVICESLWSPFLDEAFVMRYQPVTYLHFKHCKKNAYDNISPEMIPAAGIWWPTGDPLDETMLQCLRDWNLEAPVTQS